MFYGWWIVCCTFSVLCVSYGINFCFGVFLPEIASETGWSRTALSIPYSVCVGLYSIFSIASGWFTDRYGPKPVIAVGAILLGIGIVCLSRAQTLLHVYLSLGVITAAGMSAAFVPCNATVVRWFLRKRGLALSLSACGASVGNILFPPLATSLISIFQWRDAYLFLGIGGMIAMLVLSYFIVRDPEECGLKPDGKTLALEHDRELGSNPKEPSFNLRQAQKTREFWILVAIFSSTWLVVFAPVIHIPALAADLGFSPLEGATLVSSIGVGGIIGRLCSGSASDRIGCAPVLALTLVLQVASFITFAHAEHLYLLYLAAAAFGFGYGGGAVLFPAIVGEYFGRISAGAIVGFIFGTAGAAAAFGPAFTGALYDVTGNYTSAFWISAGLNTLSLFLMVLLPKRP